MQKLLKPTRPRAHPPQRQKNDEAQHGQKSEHNYSKKKQAVPLRLRERASRWRASLSGESELRVVLDCACFVRPAPLGPEAALGRGG